MAKNKNLKQILNFLYEAEKLKETYRFNEAKNIKGDSSADHSWCLALMALVIAQELKLKLNICRAIKIALIHDLPEAITGDIDQRFIVKGEITKEKKLREEKQAMKKIKKFLPTKIGKEIYSLWQDYEKGSTREAKFVKTLDKIETLIYFIGIKSNNKINMPALLGTYGNKEVKNFPKLKNIFKLVKKELKDEFKKNGFPWEKEYNIKN